MARVAARSAKDRVERHSAVQRAPSRRGSDGAKSGSAGADIAGIADRMPAIIWAQDRDRWLDCERVNAAAAAALLAPAPGGTLEAVPISERVNRVENDDRGLLAPA